MKTVSLRILRDMQDTLKNNNIILKINLKNIQKNYNYLSKIGAGSKIAACVKANSYGLSYIGVALINITLNFG